MTTAWRRGGFGFLTAAILHCSFSAAVPAASGNRMAVHAWQRPGCHLVGMFVSAVSVAFSSGAGLCFPMSHECVREGRGELRFYRLIASFKSFP